MTSRERHPFLFLAFIAALLVPAVAPGQAKVSPEQVRLTLDPGFAKSWKDVHVARLVMQTPGRQHRLDLGPMPKTAHLDVDLSQTGGDCALVLAELGSIRKHGSAADLDISSRRRVTRSSKLLVCPPGVSSEALAARRRAGVMITAKAGSRFEMRPLNNPATVRPGSLLVVRIYHEGTSRGGLRVTASGPDSATLEVLTSPTGIARLTIPSSGEWTIRYSSADGEQTHEASLSFDVLPDSTWNSMEGGAR